MSLSRRLQARRLRQWRADARWVRIRYDEPQGVSSALALFSRRKARVELRFQPGAVSTLLAGLPAAHAPLLAEMAADFGFSAGPVAAPKLPTDPLAAAGALTFGRSWSAHIVDGALSVSSTDGTGALFPSGGARQWRLPAAPPPGVRASGTWCEADPPLVADQSHTPLQAGEWVLGLTPHRARLTARGDVLLYGTGAATTAWLADSVTPHFAARTHGGLIIIDASGQLAPRLKRRRPVVRLLRDSIRYIDMRDLSARGVNPLAVLPREDRAATVRRWRAWWAAVGVNERGGLTLLPAAFDAGVRTVPDLHRWLKGRRTAQFAAVAPFLRTVEGLLASDLWDDWLTQPVDLFDAGGDHALIFACVPSRWETRALLDSVLLAAFGLRDVRIVAHGIQWNRPLEQDLMRGAHGSVTTLVSNGPVGRRTAKPAFGAATVDCGAATPVLTACPPKAVEKLTARFGGGDPVFAENLSLLKPGESVVLLPEQTVFTRWRRGGRREERPGERQAEGDRP